MKSKLYFCFLLIFLGAGAASGEDKILTKEDVKILNNWEFKDIDTLDAAPIDISATADGRTVFIITNDRKVRKYVDDKFVGIIHEFKFCPFGIAASSDGGKIWVSVSSGIDNGELWLGNADGNFRFVNNIDDLPGKLAVTSDGNTQYVIAGRKLEKYINGELSMIVKEFPNYPSGVGIDGDAKKIWMLIPAEIFNSSGVLYRNDENGDFRPAETFTHSSPLKTGVWTPTGILLSSDGSLGFIITANNSILEYKDGQRLGAIHVTDSCPTAVATTSDARVVYVVTSDRKLLKGVNKSL